MFTTSEKISQVIALIESWIKSPYGVPFVGALFFCVLVMLILWVAQKRRFRGLKMIFQFEKELQDAFQMERSCDDNINDLLGKYVKYLDAHGYYFYNFEGTHNKYVLTHTRINHERMTYDAGPLGESENRKEHYEAPQQFDLEKIPLNLGVIKEGDVKLLCIPIEQHVGFIAIGPLSKYFKLNKGLRNRLEGTQPSLKIWIALMVENGAIRDRMQEMETRTQAVSSMKHSLSDYNDMLDAITKIAMKTAEASGALILKNDWQFGFTMPVLICEELSEKDNLRREIQSFKVIEALMTGLDDCHFRKGELDFTKLPRVLLDMEIESLMVIDISYKQFRGMMCIWFKKMVELENYQRTALIMMVKKIGEVLENYQMYNEISNSYNHILRMIAQTLDEVSPNTVGRSEMMYRYAYVIASQLRLPDADCEEIALAAYFSNIGAVGLSGTVFLKADKYSDTEFEMMKLHCEVGASIIESTLDNSRIASYILQHHERMDGLGYPARLTGDEILLGARILAVVQFFTAKLTGREGRKPLPFYQALENVKSASGTQLDGEVVNVLIQWFSDKRQGPELHGKTLGNCWDMRCSPISICATCPVYGRSDRNCFEWEKNNCLAHGNTCESCFIRTEFLERGL